MAYEHELNTSSQADSPASNHQQPGQTRPTGSPDMPMSQGQNRYTYSSGARPLDGYTIKRAIGRGGFGEVYYATSDSGKEVALKLILRNLDVERRGVVQCMNLKCPNLLQIFDLKTNDAGDAFVIMEYVAGPSLANVLAKHPGGMPVAEIRAWVKGLVEGVAYLHDHGIVHRDLKPANLFMEEGLVKIGDYGLAKLINPSQGTEHSESIGTCHYMAPEIASGKYSKAIDVYAIGVIIYEMLTGRVPFEGETVGEVLMKHLTSRPNLTMLAEPFRSIVGKALAKDPNQRPQTLYDLLPADDMPKAPGVRFIGDKGSPSLPEARVGAKVVEKKDDVFRIEAEDSVFYIGPDTRPPRLPFNQRLRAVWGRPTSKPFRAAPTPVQAQARRQPSPTVAQRLAAIRRQAPPAPQPRARAVVPSQVIQPPPAPTLPSARIRVAELAGSMLKASILTAVLVVPVALMLEVDPMRNPEQASFLFATSLLGTWGALAPAKLLEGRSSGKMARRGLALFSGAIVGLGGLAFANWVRLGSLPGWDGPIFESTVPGTRMSMVSFTYPAFFGALSMLSGWPALAARDRTKRFRIFPVVKAGALGALLGLALPFPEPWGVAIGVVAATVTQWVSPWSKPAAEYARYLTKAAKASKRERKAA